MRIGTRSVPHEDRQRNLLMDLARPRSGVARSSLNGAGRESARCVIPPRLPARGAAHVETERAHEPQLNDGHG